MAEDQGYLRVKFIRIEFKLPHYRASELLKTHTNNCVQIMADFKSLNNNLKHYNNKFTM